MTKLFEWINSEEGSWTDTPTCVITSTDRKGRINKYIISIRRVDPVDYKYLKKSILVSREEIRTIRIKHYRGKEYIGGTDRICTIEYMKWIKDNKDLNFLNEINVETLDKESDIEDAKLLSKMIWYFCRERKHQDPLVYPMENFIEFEGPFID